MPTRHPAPGHGPGERMFRVTAIVDLQAVRTTMRIQPGSKVAERFDAVATQASAEASELFDVAACWSVVPNTFTGFPMGLARYRKVVLVAVTAGGRISERLTQLTEQRRLFHAIVLDAMANTVINQRCRLVEEAVRAHCHAQGLRLSRRFSPGCPHMGMDQLPVVIAALGAEGRIGVRCTRAGMLQPTKSMAYVLGADDWPADDQERDFCGTCRKTSCWRSRRSRC